MIIVKTILAFLFLIINLHANIPTSFNNVTTNTYDAYDRVVSTTDESGNTESYAYDARGNKVSTTDAQILGSGDNPLLCSVAKITS